MMEGFLLAVIFAAAREAPPELRAAFVNQIHTERPSLVLEWWFAGFLRACDEFAQKFRP